MLQSMGSQVGHDQVTELNWFAYVSNWEKI